MRKVQTCFFVYCNIDINTKCDVSVCHSQSLGKVLLTQKGLLASFREVSIWAVTFFLVAWRKKLREITLDDNYSVKVTMSNLFRCYTFAKLFYLNTIFKMFKIEDLKWFKHHILFDIYPKIYQMYQIKNCFKKLISCIYVLTFSKTSDFNLACKC